MADNLPIAFGGIALFQALRFWVNRRFFANCGVYGYRHRGQWLYIGKSTDMRRRKREHARDKRPFAKCEYKVLWQGPPWKLARKEVYYIRKHQPTLNKVRYVNG